MEDTIINLEEEIAIEPWLDEEKDASTLFEILQRDCPNGFIGTLIDMGKIKHIGGKYREFC